MQMFLGENVSGENVSGENVSGENVSLYPPAPHHQPSYNPGWTESQLRNWFGRKLPEPP